MVSSNLLQIDERKGVSAMDNAKEPRTLTITRAQKIYTSWFIDILIYVIILNLFVEYHVAVFIESFTISILTALLLKLMLVLIGRLEHRVHHYFEQKEGTIFRIIGPVVVISILVLGKLLILEVVDLVFGDRVELGHFVTVMFLILSMIIAQRLAVWGYKRLGTSTGTDR